MHIIVISAQSPIAVRHTVLGADDIFIFVKRSVFGGAFFNFFPKCLCQATVDTCIVIRIDGSLFLIGKIKNHIADFDILIACILGIDILCRNGVYIFIQPIGTHFFIKVGKDHAVKIIHKAVVNGFSKVSVGVWNGSQQGAVPKGNITVGRIISCMPVFSGVFRTRPSSQSVLIYLSHFFG